MTFRSARIQAASNRKLTLLDYVALALFAAWFANAALSASSQSLASLIRQGSEGYRVTRQDSGNAETLSDMRTKFEHSSQGRMQ